MKQLFTNTESDIITRNYYNSRRKDIYILHTGPIPILLTTMKFINQTLVFKSQFIGDQFLSPQREYSSLWHVLWWSNQSPPLCRWMCSDCKIRIKIPSCCIHSSSCKRKCSAKYRKASKNANNNHFAWTYFIPTFLAINNLKSFVK